MSAMHCLINPKSLQNIAVTCVCVWGGGVIEITSACREDFEDHSDVFCMKMTSGVQVYDTHIEQSEL